MEFPKINIITDLLSPPSFKREVHSIEYREDPLTGTLCRINTKRTRRVKESPIADLSEITAESGDCPFCPQNIEQKTPLFSGRGRIKRGDCYLFPNLFPFAEYHATATLTGQHFLELDQFKIGMVVDNISAAKEYLLWVYKKDRGAKYPIYLWNHLPPSAASIIHPHVQILVDRKPTLYQQRLLHSSKGYFLESGRNFWRDIVEEEKKRRERYIGSNDSLSAIASYAPQGNREIQIIFKEACNLADLDELQIADFADCLIKLLRGYKQMGVSTFNLSTFSGPLGESPNYYSLHAKLISRPALQPFYRNDTGILERLHYEADIELEPEVVASKMRTFFEGDF